MSNDRKVVNLAEVQDAQAKAKKLVRGINEEMSDLTKAISVQEIESNAQYLSELKDIHKGVERDLEAVGDTVNALFRAVVADAEETVRQASNLRA